MTKKHADTKITEHNPRSRSDKHITHSKETYDKTKVRQSLV